MELTAIHLTHLKAAAEEATFERLYSHEVRQRYGGAAEWDLSTCESDDPEAPDCESIARLYHRDNINYFIEVTPERVLAMVEEVRRLRAEAERQAAVIAGLREALEPAEPYVGVYDSTIPDSDDAAPVEPAPAREIAYVVDDRVIVREGHKLAGMVGSVWDVYKGGLKGYYTVELDDIGLHTFTHAQLDREPAEPEASAREIAVGDKVRIVKKGYDGETATVLGLVIFDDTSYFVTVHSTGKDDEFKRDEIEPA